MRQSNKPTWGSRFAELKTVVAAFSLIPVAYAVIFLSSRAASGQRSTAASTTITITRPPHWGIGGPDTMEAIAGQVLPVCRQCKVVLFSLGDVWYVQPWANRPYTDIQSAGNFESEIHLGSRYAALLVDPSRYKPPMTLVVLPPIGDGILAVTMVKGKK